MKWIIFDGWENWDIEDIENTDDWIEENAIHDLGKEILIKVDDAIDLLIKYNLIKEDSVVPEK